MWRTHPRGSAQPAQPPSPDRAGQSQVGWAVTQRRESADLFRAPLSATSKSRLIVLNPSPLLSESLSWPSPRREPSKLSSFHGADSIYLLSAMAKTGLIVGCTVGGVVLLALLVALVVIRIRRSSRRYGKSTSSRCIDWHQQSVGGDAVPAAAGAAGAPFPGFQEPTKSWVPPSQEGFSVHHASPTYGYPPTAPVNEGVFIPRVTRPGVPLPPPPFNPEIHQLE
jgi:hypothetical protein